VAPERGLTGDRMPGSVEFAMMRNNGRVRRNSVLNGSDSEVGETLFGRVCTKARCYYMRPTLGTTSFHSAIQLSHQSCLPLLSQANLLHRHHMTCIRCHLIQGLPVGSK